MEVLILIMILSTVVSLSMLSKIVFLDSLREMILLFWLSVVDICEVFEIIFISSISLMLQTKLAPFFIS